MTGSAAVGKLQGMSSLLNLFSILFANLLKALGRPVSRPAETPEDPINGTSSNVTVNQRQTSSNTNLEQQLSAHFRLSEFLVSNAGARAGLDNTPSVSVIANLKRLAAILELVRSYLYSVAIIISSGYRSDLINALIGGAANSAHKDGLAVDFIAPGYGRPLAIAKAIAASGIPFDQLILEGTWVHLAIAPQGQAPRMQVLTAVFQSGRPTTYLKGIVE